MHTEKDGEIVAWIGRIGAAGAEQVMERFAMGRSWAYARLGRLVLTGLLEQRALLYRRPGLYIATAEGLRWQGLQTGTQGYALVRGKTRHEEIDPRRATA